jgi:cell division protease FtsH
MEAREKILNIHAQNKHLSQDVDLHKISSKTVGYSGADLENVMNEAAIAAVKNRKKSISQKNLEDAVEKISMGPERRSRRINTKEREIISHHEVGHALAGHFTKNCEPVHKISIISRGSALGVTWFLPEEDTYLNSEQKMFDEMVSLHGGRMAEKMIFGQTTTGASNDLERISKIARSMVMTYGMGGNELGAVVFAEKSRGFAGLEFHEKEFSETTAEKIDKAVKNLVEKSEKEAEKILKKHEKLLKKIAQDLLKKETLSRKEFLAYFK